MADFLLLNSGGRRTGRTSGRPSRGGRTSCRCRLRSTCRCWGVEDTARRRRWPGGTTAATAGRRVGAWREAMVERRRWAEEGPGRGRLGAGGAPRTLPLPASSRTGSARSTPTCCSTAAEEARPGRPDKPGLGPRGRRGRPPADTSPTIHSRRGRPARQGRKHFNPFLRSNNNIHSICQPDHGQGGD